MGGAFPCSLASIHSETGTYVISSTVYVLNMEAKAGVTRMQILPVPGYIGVKCLSNMLIGIPFILPKEV